MLWCPAAGHPPCPDARPHRCLCLQLRSQVGEGRCFSVNCSEKAKEQALQVLKHFNVQVSLGDIFSRCQVGPAQPRPWPRLPPALRALRCLRALGLASGSSWAPRVLLDLWQHLAKP